MNLPAGQRNELIAAYAAGSARLRTAYEAVPEEARTWKPAPADFSAHEVVCHCADSETNSYARIRRLIADPAPAIIQGYDGDAWAKLLEYSEQSAELALDTVAAVRASTAPLIRRLGEAQWAASGAHSESGHYTAEDWLRIYAAHCEEHAQQIEAVCLAWRAR